MPDMTINHVKLTRSIYSFAKRYSARVGKAHLHEDAASEGLIHALNHVKKYNPNHKSGSSMMSWLQAKGRFGVKDWFRYQEIGCVPGAVPGRNAIRKGTAGPFGRPCFCLHSLIRGKHGEAESALYSTIAIQQESPSAGPDTRDLLRSILMGLDKRSRDLLLLYYFEDLTFKEIGECLDISESRVCQLHTKTIDGLKARFMAKRQYS